MHFTVTIYYTIISKFQKIAKNSKTVWSSKKKKKKKKNHKPDEWYHIWCLYRIWKLSDQNWRRKMYFTDTMYYTIISKFQKFAKNSKIFWSWNEAQARWVILDACMKFENYPINYVGVDAFYSYYILYHYFKISKNSPKIQKRSDRQKKKTKPQARWVILYLMPV